MRRTLLGLVVALATASTLAAPAPAGAERGRPPLEMVRAPSIDGTPRFGHTLEADAGRWRPRPTSVGYQWVRDGRPIRGADRWRYEVRPSDVGHRVGVVVTVRAPEHAPTTAFERAGRIKHRVDVRRTVRYIVRKKGSVSVPVAQFRRLAQQTYDDPRGWRGKGVRFVRVRNGGAFTLWISQARLVPSFSSFCSAQWSCRVGRNVIMNQDRWRNASPAWNRGNRSLRDYRHMVVNHETGHWLGYGHAGCPRRGAPAPVMMQQSKGTDGCRFNPWPTLAELRR